jgi:hypothetical protein
VQRGMTVSEWPEKVRPHPMFERRLEQKNAVLS